MQTFAKAVSGPASIYLTGGASAVLHGWREMTVDIDLKADPEPQGFFLALDRLKQELDINIELASPDLFVPALPGWRGRSIWCGGQGGVEFYHFDFYTQALAKLERSHPRDLVDVQGMLDAGFVLKPRLLELFQEVVPQLIRYPNLDAAQLIAKLENFCAA